MAPTRFQRRKEARPAEITEAALAAFAENGYDATRVDDVAKRAGVSKGLLYLYFKTKEELFKAVIRSFVSPRVDELTAAIDDNTLSAEAFLRGPFLNGIKQVPKSPIRILLRLMVSEGPKHPDLTTYYWEQVVSPALKAFRRLIAKGIQAGEFRPTALAEFPQLLVAPVLFSTLWTIVFERHEMLDTDELLEAHIDLMLGAIKYPEPGEAQ